MDISKEFEDVEMCRSDMVRFLADQFPASCREVIEMCTSEKAACLKFLSSMDMDYRRIALHSFGVFWGLDQESVRVFAEMIRRDPLNREGQLALATIGMNGEIDVARDCLCVLMEIIDRSYGDNKTKVEAYCHMVCQAMLVGIRFESTIDFLRNYQVLLIEKKCPSIDEKFIERVKQYIDKGGGRGK